MNRDSENSYARLCFLLKVFFNIARDFIMNDALALGLDPKKEESKYRYRIKRDPLGRPITIWVIRKRKRLA